MKIIYNSVIPFRGFIAMMTIFILWIRKEYKGSKQLGYDFFNHEKIHSYQQIEIWVSSIIIMVSVCLFTNLSWWWLLFTPVIPFIIYGLCWIIEILLPPYNMAYKNICFETEAVYNEWDTDYLGKKRKLFTFAFLKYISNKKYPALSRNQRRKRIIDNKYCYETI